MEVIIAHEDGFRLDDILSSLSPWFTIRAEPMDRFVANGGEDAPFAVFCTGLASDAQYRRVRQALEAFEGESLFVLPTHNSRSVARLRELAAGDYFVQPVDGESLRAAARMAVNRRVEQSWAALGPVRETALKTGLGTFEKCFTCARRGQRLPMDDISLSCQQIREAAELGEFDLWIDALAGHHNGSFKHTMFVCGALTYFSHGIGIGGVDLERLAIGGLLHDVGKAKVPLEILDKPAKLDDDEWIVMREHPVHSREILFREQGVDEKAIAMAVHHHERLDGGGYPDGLTASEIDDSTRLTAIADVYSALIEKRAYKPAMTSEEALDLMGTFLGHLDLDLLKAFRGFVLDAA